MNRHGDACELVTANALWPARDVELRPDYVAMAKKDFGAKIERLDFAHAADEAAKTINAWVSDATRAKIKNLVAPGSLDAGSRMVLTVAESTRPRHIHGEGVAVALHGADDRARPVAEGRAYLVPHSVVI